MKETKSAIMQGIEAVSSKIVGNNTIEYCRANGDRVIRLHHTDIVELKANGDVLLSTGGWKTVTTKSRINEYVNQYARYSVNRWYLSSERGQWFLSQYTGTGENKPDKYLFQDGITIKTNDTIEGAGEYIDVKAITSRIKKYVNGYMIALENGDVKAPGAGDCFCCQLSEAGTGAMAGQAIHDTDHLTSHFNEAYYVPSLLAQAIKVFPVSKVAQWYLSDKWAGTNNHISEDFARGQLKKSLYRFIKRQFGLQA